MATLMEQLAAARAGVVVGGLAGSCIKLGLAPADAADATVDVGIQLGQEAMGALLEEHLDAGGIGIVETQDDGVADQADRRFIELAVQGDRAILVDLAARDGAEMVTQIGRRTGLDLGAAREKLRVAAALADLNHIAAAMARGQLSYSKVRALTRVATPATEARLLAVALGATAAHVERLVRAWRRADRDAQADAEQVRLASRALSMQVDEDGMIVMRGRLTPEVGAVLLCAVEAALEQVPATAEGGESTIAQRRAVALGLVAESALAGGLDPGNPAGWSQETPMGSSGSCARTASRCRRGQAGKGLRWRRPTRGWRQPASASAPTPPPPSGTGSRST